MRDADTHSLVADVGGTNTRVALARGAVVDAGTIRRYANARFDGLDAVLARYLEDEGGVDCIGTAVCIAGPVRDEVGTLTNLDWTIDKPTLARATRAEHVTILNDLQAQGQALGALGAGTVERVLDGPAPAPHAAKLVIGIGTGFNAAPVLEAEQGRLVPPSESGHGTLPIRTEAELRLGRFVETAHGFPAIEDVLSGRGLERIYAWLGHEAGDPRERGAADIMASLEAGTDPRADAAVDQFVTMMGAVAGNLALIHLPFGGVYLVGGVARAMKPHLARFGFGGAFRDKGRFTGFMSNFAVHVVEDDYAALIGLASHLDRTIRAT
jgi:glucokinase